MTPRRRPRAQPPTRAKARGALRSSHRTKLFVTRRRRAIVRRRREQAAKYVSTARQFAALTSAEREARDEALEVVSLMRRGLSFTQAARQVGVTPTTIRRYAGVVLRRTRNGQVVATRADRLLRRMQVLTSEGKQTINLRGSRSASIVAKHWSVIRKYLETGDERGLQAFTDVFPGGKRFATDPVVIDREARRGELDFEDIYDLTA